MLSGIVEFLTGWAGLLALVLTCANIIVNWANGYNKKIEDRVSRVETAIADHQDETNESLKTHDRRIQAIEDDDKHQPTKDDLHELSLQVKELSTELKGLRHTVDRMDRHLLERGA